MTKSIDKTEKMTAKVLAAASAIALTLVISTKATARGGHGPGDMSEEREKFHVAFQTCATDNGISIDRESGVRPTAEQRAVIDACLKAKGFSPPPKHGQRPPPPLADEQ